MEEMLICSWACPQGNHNNTAPTELPGRRPGTFILTWVKSLSALMENTQQLQLRAAEGLGSAKQSCWSFYISKKEKKKSSLQGLNFQYFTGILLHFYCHISFWSRRNPPPLPPPPLLCTVLKCLKVLKSSLDKKQQQQQQHDSSNVKQPFRNPRNSPRSNETVLPLETHQTGRPPSPVTWTGTTAFTPSNISEEKYPGLHILLVGK